MRNPPQGSRRDWFVFKVALVLAVFSLGIAGTWARAYWLQVVQGPDLARKARAQHWTSEVVSGKRGAIVDRNGVVLATSVRVASVAARPGEIKDPDRTAQALARVLGGSPGAIAQKLKSSGKFVWIARKISDAQAQAIRELQLAGVVLENEFARQYPQGWLAGQLLGFVDVDGRGIEGVERQFDAVLRPSEVKYALQRDAQGNRLGPSPADVDALDGKPVALTIDAQVQVAAETALERAVVGSRAKSGMCMVVDATSGEILAWANYPFFNPNAGVKNRGEWKNRIAVDIFEPGSIFKPLVVAAALEEGVCSPTTRYFCENGQWSVLGKRIKDTHSYGSLTINEIVRYSSNIGMAKLGLDLGGSRFRKYLEALGFGKTTGLPLPGEAAGLVKPLSQWRKVEQANISFGQGIGVTMSQMMQAYLTLAREGERIPLRLVPSSAPQESVRVFSPKTARAVLSMLAEVVESNGTGTLARIEGVRVGGKTGTAQKASRQGGYGTDYVASFFALLPVDKPKYVVGMVVDSPGTSHYGGVVAAPAVRDVGVRLLTLAGMLKPAVQPAMLAEAAQLVPRKSLPDSLKVSGKVENAVASSPPLLDARNATAVPDVRGLTVREALEVLVPYGVELSVAGSGAVVQRQMPVAGGAWPDGKHVRLWLAREPDDG
jgi:cell division protein FtsI (penicillin-binding protein 3)